MRTTIQEDLLLAIIDNPDQDEPRLVYADWLEEGSSQAHAKLIRVQCELARLPKRASEKRKKLKTTEAKLLACPELQLLRQLKDAGHQCDRGFILNYQVSLDGGEYPPEIEAYLKNTRGLKWEEHLDKILTINLCFTEGIEPNRAYWANIAQQQWLRRVTLVRFYKCVAHANPIGALAQSPHFLNVKSVEFIESTIPLESVADLILCPSIRHLNLIGLSNSFTFESIEITDPNNIHIDTAIRRIVLSEQVSHLTALIIDIWRGGIGKAAALAILESPYLTNLRRLSIHNAHHIPPRVRNALKHKFEAVDLFGSSGVL